MKTYDTYKDSGVEWLGKIPSHWELSRLKYITEFINGAAFKPDDWKDSGIPIVRIQNLNGQQEFNFVDKSLVVNESCCLKGGELLFAWSGNIGTSFGPFIWKGGNNAYLNQHIFKLDKYSLNKKYFYWLLKAVTTYIESKAHGIIGLVHITKDEIGLIEVPIIKLSEQRAIAAYLDKKTEAIDRLIEEKEALLERLRQTRQSVINEAVTKGLDPHAEMKDSGVKWIGKIPKHWEVKKLKYVGETIIGITYSPKEIVDEKEGILVMRSSNIQNGEIVLLDCVYVKKSINKKHIIKKNDILVCSRNGSVNLIGKNVLITNDQTAMTFGAFMTIFRSPINEFVYYFFNSDVFKSQIGLFSTSTINQLTSGVLNNMMVAIPTNEVERNSIKNYINARVIKIDKVYKNIGSQIEKLKAYRRSLISEVVTGKVKVT